MAISAAPEYLFAANPESGDVTVLDVQTRDSGGVRRRWAGAVLRHLHSR